MEIKDRETEGWKHSVTHSSLFLSSAPTIHIYHGKFPAWKKREQQVSYLLTTKNKLLIISSIPTIK